MVWGEWRRTEKGKGIYLSAWKAKQVKRYRGDNLVLEVCRAHLKALNVHLQNTLCMFIAICTFCIAFWDAIRDKLFCEDAIILHAIYTLSQRKAFTEVSGAGGRYHLSSDYPVGLLTPILPHPLVILTNTMACTGSLPFHVWRKPSTALYTVHTLSLCLILGLKSSGRRVCLVSLKQGVRGRELLYHL